MLDVMRLNYAGSPGSELRSLLMQGVHKRFGATVALAGVDLTVQGGEVLALVGENGAGKSTLMKVLSGAHRPDAGRMLLDGTEYAPRDPLEARRAGVAMIYQELSLAKHLSVMENIVLGMEPARAGLLSWRTIQRTAAEALAQLGRPDIPLGLPVSRLSVAEQQLVEVGRAVAIGCRVLVLDEPTSSLTRPDIVRLFELVRRLRMRGVAVIYISHFLEEVKEIADRFVVLRDGKTVGTGPAAEAITSDIIAMMVGRTVEDLYPRSARTPGAVVLEVNRLITSGTRADEAPSSAEAGGRSAGPATLDYATSARGSSLSLRRGEVLGIAGLVGAGRTEFLRGIFALDRVRSGDVRVMTNVRAADLERPRRRRGLWPRDTPSRRWTEGIGMVSEDRKAEGLALSLSVAENLTLSRLPPITSPAGEARSARPWIERLGIRCRSPRQAVGDLSGGNQQKLALARLLHHDVEVLLLDEPTRGIDVASKAEIYRVIDQLAAAGKAVLMVSSYLPELLGICDRIAVMHRGVLGQARAVADTDEHRIMMEATGAGGT
jgi:ribose transport system ATP-binding protein